jgi:hypothetical protein
VEQVECVVAGGQRERRDIPCGGYCMGGACMRGCMEPGAGPPTPRAGPASPAGACPGAAAGTPRPAARPIPGPDCRPSPPHRPSNLHTVRVCGRGEQAAIPVATRHSLSPQGEGQGAPPPINTRQGLLHAAWMHKLCYSRCHSRNLPTMWREGKSQCPRAHM